MADARALLRAHRAENRIKHPHAAYSDAGKLLCKLCHEPVKAESLWENHVRGANHRKRAQQQQQQPQTASTTDRSSNNSTGAAAGVGGGKRKLDDVDESQSSASDSASEDAIRRKRSRASISEKRQTPPVLGRRASNTPAQGVEIAIPSRPATPAAGSNSATSTPKGLPVGRSPLIGTEAQTGTPMSISTPTSTPSQNSLPISTQSLAGPSAAATANSDNNNANNRNNSNNNATSQTQSNPVDEAEWAAFEAEIATAEAAPASNGNAYDGATISAPALSTAQLAAKSEEEENERRKHLLDAQIADEREDATLALEAEFAEMEELESRVRRLKERREELRKGSVANLRAAAGGDDSDVSMTKSPASGKENESAGVIEEEDEEDDDDDDEDDWDAFRFR